jgi:hypothetical protein
VAFVSAVDDMARDIAFIEPNLVDWGWWVMYLLDQMEVKAQRRVKHYNFEKMFKSLNEKIISATKKASGETTPTLGIKLGRTPIVRII